MREINGDIILRATELTGVVGRKEMDKLALVYGQERWGAYRASYEKVTNLEDRDYPIQLDIELNRSCNLRCPMCPSSAESQKNKGKATWFSKALYKDIIEDAVRNGLQALKLNYINEPLIRPDFHEFVEYARSAGVLDVYMSTNGVLMTPDVSRKLVVAGLSRIQISVDAVDQDVYGKMRPGGDLKRVIRNIDALVDIKKQLKSVTPLIRVNFVRTEINEMQLPEFIEYWRDKVDMIGVQEYIKPTQSKGDIKSKSSSNKRKDGFRCSFPFKQLVITNDLKVLPCCTFWGEALAIEKLVSAGSIKKIWNGEAMRRLRKIHLDGRYYEVPECLECVEGGLA